MLYDSLQMEDPRLSNDVQRHVLSRIEEWGIAELARDVGKRTLKIGVVVVFIASTASADAPHVTAELPSAPGCRVSLLEGDTGLSIAERGNTDPTLFFEWNSDIQDWQDLQTGSQGDYLFLAECGDLGDDQDQGRVVEHLPK
jgi:hypothetical protein